MHSLPCLTPMLQNRSVGFLEFNPPLTIKPPLVAVDLKTRGVKLKIGRRPRKFFRFSTTKRFQKRSETVFLQVQIESYPPQISKISRLRRLLVLLFAFVHSVVLTHVCSVWTVSTVHHSSVQFRMSFWSVSAPQARKFFRFGSELYWFQVWKCFWTEGGKGNRAAGAKIFGVQDSDPSIVIN